MQNNLREIRKVIYRLKRQWGLQLTYIRPTGQSNDVETGEIVRTFEKIYIKRGILLPSSLDRSFVYDLTFIAANNNFVGGAFFDRDSRVILLDGTDLPKDFKPHLKDHVEFDNTRYELLSVNPTAQYKAYLIRVQAITSSGTVEP